MPDVIYRREVSKATMNNNIQSSQNVPAAGHLAAYNEISAAYFTLVRLVFRTRLPLLPITIASLPTTQKHFDWAEHTCILISHGPYGYHPCC